MKKVWLFEKQAELLNLPLSYRDVKESFTKDWTAKYGLFRQDLECA